MKLTTQEVRDIVRQELMWCMTPGNEPVDHPIEWRDGFVQGLQQALRIIEAAEVKVSARIAYKVAVKS